MKFLKIHLPDCSQTFSFVKEHGGTVGTCLGKGVGIGIGWTCVVLAVTCVFMGMIAFKSMVGMSVALMDVMETAWRFTKGGIDGLSDGESRARQSEIDTSNFFGRVWRRSA